MPDRQPGRQLEPELGQAGSDCILGQDAGGGGGGYGLWWEWE